VTPVRAPQPLSTLSDWLRCPNCLADLHATDALVLSCDNGHRFDANRRGYVSLVTGSRRLIGDSPAMLDAREAFLGRGWYSFVRDALSELVIADNPQRVVDIGCGTGYYLRGVLKALTEESGTAAETATAHRALAMDLSAHAVARTVRAVSQVPGTATAGLVADVWSPLPVRDRATDVIINVFAPRNAAEFHRILAPGGLLAVVVPHQSHLQELRADGMALDVHENKKADLVTALHGRFSLESTRELSDVLSLSPTDVTALIGMGPSAHHAPDTGHDTGTASSATSSSFRPVTVAFQLLAFRRSQV
jgi:23S rRNA (guanine745-N1)-methyltransferase